MGINPSMLRLVFCHPGVWMTFQSSLINQTYLLLIVACVGIAAPLSLYQRARFLVFFFEDEGRSFLLLFIIPFRAIPENFFKEHFSLRLYVRSNIGLQSLACTTPIMSFCGF